MRRVVVTGMGIVSSIGNNCAEVLSSLRSGRSGVVFCPQYREMGFRSRIAGVPTLRLEDVVDRRVRRFMGDAAGYSYVALREAIGDSGLEEREVRSESTGLVFGSGGASPSNQVLAADIARKKGIKRVGPYMVPRCMSSTTSANLATSLGVRGTSYTISSACATSAHCIGVGSELIRAGTQDVVLVGGGEEVHWSLTMLFDAMGALSSKYNDCPQSASRAYDVGRDGFVISGGGGALVLEEEERARARGAHIYAQLSGYTTTSDGVDMVAPSVEGAARALKMILQKLGNRRVDYINAHGTSTPIGDLAELEAIKRCFSQGEVPFVSSTKSLTGHAQGAAGVHEAIYGLLMLEHQFMCASSNIQELVVEAEGVPVLRELRDSVAFSCVLSNSFGFGGTNVVLAFTRDE